MRSFYLVAGIHALPYTAYDGVTGGAQEYYNDTDWATVEEAKKIALQYPDNEKEKYVEAAKQLCHPFWDWADVKKNVKNLLKSFTLPLNLAYPLGKGQNPTDKPNYNVPNLTYNPYTPAGYSTARHPNSNYEDQTDLLNSNMTVYVPTVFRSGMYQMFHISDFLRFSSHGVNPDGMQAGNLFSAHPSHSNPVGLAHFASMEATHDDVHLVLGGLGGHMSYVDLAAFDPMFFFHHTNVDRLLALWQGNVNEINQAIDENTDLTLFRKTKTKFWKSSDVSHIEKPRYTYLEVEKVKGQDPKKLKAYVLELYYRSCVFIDLPDANDQTLVTSPHFADLVSMWSSTKNHVYDNTFVMRTVDITAAME
ncbi:10571_t:CDS:2 [Gigaspora rosea]|nr:10571_t:CDS:2 [Gigaspora rosea]